jgi:hypothetical protein
VGRIGIGGDNMLSLSAVIGGCEPSLGAVMAEVRLLEFPPMEDSGSHQYEDSFERRRVSRVVLEPGPYIPVKLTRDREFVADGQLVNLSHSGLGLSLQRRQVRALQGISESLHCTFLPPGGQRPFRLKLQSKRLRTDRAGRTLLGCRFELADAQTTQGIALARVRRYITRHRFAMLWRGRQARESQ